MSQTSSGALSPLLKACQETRTDLPLIQSLLNKGTDLEQVDRFHNTALCFAVMRNHPEVVRLLIEHGANIHHTTKGVCRPMMLASMRNHHEILSLLIRAGAGLDCQDEDGRTALMAACLTGSVDCFKLLLEAGANLALRDRAGHSVLGYFLLGKYCFPGEWGRIENIVEQFVALTTATDISLAGDFHLLILYNYNNDWTRLPYDDWIYLPQVIEKGKVLPSLEYLNTNILPPGMSYLEGQGLTPFSCALLVDNHNLARFFASNWFFHARDLSLFHSMPQFLQQHRESRQFVKAMFSQPWTLKSLSFVQVSTCLGFGPSRRHRVKRSGLPPLLQRWLRFETPEWNISWNKWSELTFSCVHSNRTNCQQRDETTCASVSR